MSKENRSNIVSFAKMDWDHLVFHGVSWKEAREKVENDYELSPGEKADLRIRLLEEMERQQGMGIV